MLRVIAGKARNLQLKTPEGLDTRPTTERIRETLFNVLQNDIPGSVVIDFFAGSGAIGIESLSRGAVKAYLVDNSREALNCIVDNLKHTHLEDQATVISQDALNCLYQIHEKHVDLVFMDPPYDKGLEKELLLRIKDMPYISDETIFVVEARLDTDFSYLDGCGFNVYKEKKYKTNKHLFLTRKEAEK